MYRRSLRKANGIDVRSLGGRFRLGGKEEREIVFVRNEKEKEKGGGGLYKRTSQQNVKTV